MHHFLISPIPDYVEFGAITTTIAIEVVVTTVVVNFFMTLRGKWSALRTSMAIRWFYAGAIMYFITCLQCAFQVTWTFQKIIHFTDWVVGHAHMIMFGTFTFWLFGVIDWLWPRIVRAASGTRTRLRSWHFWLSTIGIAIMFIDLTIAGLIAGFMQKELNHWMDIVDRVGSLLVGAHLLRRDAGRRLLCIALQHVDDARRGAVPTSSPNNHLVAGAAPTSEGTHGTFYTLVLPGRNRMLRRRDRRSAWCSRG